MRLSFGWSGVLLLALGMGLPAVAGCGGSEFSTQTDPGDGVDAAVGGSAGSSGQGGEAGQAGEAGQGGESGQGGEGGQAQPECVTPDDCPAPDEECRTKTCDDGVCGWQNTPEGYEVETQMAGDCKVAVCDGNGGVVERPDVDDYPPPEPCMAYGCDENGITPLPVDALTLCTQDGSSDPWYCDGNGNCVQCVTEAQCNPGDVCSQGKCVAPTCANNVHDPGNGETDVDCGGTVCEPCGTGMTCKTHADCASHVCNDDDKTCSAPACNDGVKNGNETDVDCGGGCEPCETGQACEEPTDCKSLVCGGQQGCLPPACDDSVKNGDESDTDCGGSCPDKCADGSHCNVNADCQSGACDTNAHQCVAPDHPR